MLFEIVIPMNDTNPIIDPVMNLITLIGYIVRDRYEI